MGKNVEIKHSLNNITDSSIIVNNPEIIKENIELKQIIEVLFGKNYESFLLAENKNSTALIIHLNNILKGKTIFETIELLKDEQEKRKELLEKLYSIKNSTNNPDFITVLNEAEKLLLEFKYEEYHEILNKYDEIEYKLRNKESANINYIRAQEYDSRFEFVEAIKYCKIALERDKSYKYADFLGRIFDRKGDYNNSILYYKKALELAEATNANIKDLSIILTGLGLVYYNNKENKNAIDCLKKSLNYVELEDENTASNYNNLGLVYDANREFNKALTYHFLSLKINLKLLGRENISIATDYNNIGNTYEHYGQYKKAIKYLKDAIEIIKNLKGEKYHFLAVCYNNLGNVYLSQNKNKQSFKYFKKALEIDLVTIGKHHPETAKDYGNIAKYYQRIKDYEKSIENSKISIEIVLNTLGSSHSQMATAYNNLSYTYIEKGDNVNALKYIELAYKINREFLGEEHIETKTNLENLLYCKNLVNHNQIYPMVNKNLFPLS